MTDPSPTFSKDRNGQVAATTRKFHVRDEQLLLDTVSMLCDVMWNGGRTKPGQHVWSIPVDQERDFDCILHDAIVELSDLRKLRDAQQDQIAALTRDNKRLSDLAGAMHAESMAVERAKSEAEGQLAHLLAQMEKLTKAEMSILLAIGQNIKFACDEHRTHAAVEWTRLEQSGFLAEERVEELRKSLPVETTPSPSDQEKS
jgi:hypothetical protein